MAERANVEHSGALLREPFLGFFFVVVGSFNVPISECMARICQRSVIAADDTLQLLSDTTLAAAVVYVCCEGHGNWVVCDMCNFYVFIHSFCGCFATTTFTIDDWRICTCMFRQIWYISRCMF